MTFGDNVRLKSGGPIMTIVEIGTLDDKDFISARCAWFNEESEAKFAVFPTDALVPV